VTLFVDTSVWSLAFGRDRGSADPELGALRSALEGGEIVVCTMSAASWNVRPATSHRAKSSHTARFSKPEAYLLTMTRNVAISASTVPIAMTRIATASMASARWRAVSCSRFSIVAPKRLRVARYEPGGVRTMQRNPRWHVALSASCAMRAAGR
jgi:hypothetical protein